MNTIILNAYCNGKATKKECAEFRRPVPYTPTPIPVTKNGAIITGVYPDGKCLAVIDFDVRSPQIDLNSSPHLDFDTYTSETGSKGRHVYFWIIDGVVPNASYMEEIKNKKTGEVKPGPYRFNFGLGKLLKGIDVRGEGGIIFAPGCKFTEHPYPYTVLKDRPIMKISLEIFNAILGSLMVKRPVVPNLRKGFADILTGAFIIDHGTQAATGMPEFTYWAAFWREYLNVGGDKAAAFSELTITQPEFDAATTEAQLKYLKQADKRPSREFYGELFPQYASEQLPAQKPATGGVDTEKMKEFEDRLADLESAIMSITDYIKIKLAKIPRRGLARGQ